MGRSFDGEENQFERGRPKARHGRPKHRFYFLILLLLFHIYMYKALRSYMLYITISINVELTSNFLLYRGLVHHHHRILNLQKLSATPGAN